MMKQQCQNCKTEFVIEEEDLSFYQKINVPPPTWCPECRTIRRMIFRNERALYKRKCDATEKDIISMYSPESPFPVYEQKYWWSDNWDPLEYGTEYDFTKPFFDQLNSLSKRVPRYALYNVNTVNSEYCNINIDLKDCYLLFGSGMSENCLYGDTVHKSRDCIDNNWVGESERSAHSVDLQRCYNVAFAQNCQDCNDCFFVYDCRGCKNVVFSSGLRNKEYYVFNRPTPKEEYKKFFATLHESLGSHKNMQESIDKFEKVKQSAIHRYMIGKNYARATGNFIYNSKDVRNSYVVSGVENIAHGIKALFGQKDSADIFGVSGGQLVYETLNADYCSGGKFLLNGTSVVDCQYSIDIHNSEHLFGCIGLRNKQYCILNKQYARKEWEALVPKIIAHMNEMPHVDSKARIYRYGEFFPVDISPFAYNESVAQQYFPLTKGFAGERGYRWEKTGKRDYAITKEPQALPDHIKDVNEEILEEIVGCAHDGNCNEQCTTAFKIIPQELRFYQMMNLPLPRLCSNCRHYQRLKQRNPFKLWHRQCMCDYGVHQNFAKHIHHEQGRCPNEFETSYAPDRPEIVYCEACYQNEVI